MVHGSSKVKGQATMRLWGETGVAFLGFFVVVATRMPLRNDLVGGPVVAAHKLAPLRALLVRVHLPQL